MIGDDWSVDHPVVAALSGVADRDDGVGGRGWIGTAAELLVELERGPLLREHLPRDPTRLSAALKRSRAALLDAGVRWFKHRMDGRRLLHLELVPRGEPAPPMPAESPEPVRRASADAWAWCPRCGMEIEAGTDDWTKAHTPAACAERAEELADLVALRRAITPSTIEPREATVMHPGIEPIDSWAARWAGARR